MPISTSTRGGSLRRALLERVESTGIRPPPDGPRRPGRDEKLATIEDGGATHLPYRRRQAGRRAGSDGRRQADHATGDRVNDVLAPDPIASSDAAARAGTTRTAPPRVVDMTERRPGPERSEARGRSARGVRSGA